MNEAPLRVNDEYTLRIYSDMDNKIRAPKRCKGSPAHRPRRVGMLPSLNNY